MVLGLGSGLAVCFASVRASSDEPPRRVLASELGDKCEVIGKLGVPLGKLVKIAGVVVEGHSKGYDSGLKLRVQRIDGAITQKFIQIRFDTNLVEYFGSEKSAESVEPKLGESIEFTGFETGGFAGPPYDLMKSARVLFQTSSFQFHTRFDATDCRLIKPIVYSPTDFVDRQALLSGTAKAIKDGPVIVGDGWELRVGKEKSRAWPSHMEGKQVEAFGTVRRGEDGKHWRMEGARLRLVRLEDQVGREVSLRGTAWSRNGKWWLDYRGTDVQVEQMASLPGWSSELHGEAVEISGVLGFSDFKSSEGETRNGYVIQKAKWKKIDGLLFPELAIEK